MNGPAKKIVEKRLHPRQALRTRVVFEDEFGDGLFYVHSRDLSLGGIFLESDIPLQVGTMMFVSFCLPGHLRPVRLTAEVVRKAGKGPDDSGMGVRFVGLPELARKRLIEFLGGEAVKSGKDRVKSI